MGRTHADRLFHPSPGAGARRWRIAPRMARFRVGIQCSLLGVLGGLGQLPLLAEEAAGAANERPQQAASPDLYQAVAHFQLDLEMLRWVTGSPRVALSPWAVSMVEPRHLLWQAQVMFRKASQFAEEIAGTRELALPPGSWRRTQPRPPASGDIQLDDVLRVVVDAHERIRATIELQNIRMVGGQRPDRDVTKTAGDALAQIVQGNRQLNFLLHREVPPRDAYNRVMAAVERAGDLLGGTYPPLSPLVAGKRPDDVYGRLITCLGLLRSAASTLEIPTLALDLDRELARQDVSGADVYHLATTLLSDLEYMTRLLGREATKPPRGEYPNPPFVFPSHIHQLAGVLETQLRNLASTANPKAGDVPAGAATGENGAAAIQILD